jgi:hypothetical protein
MAGPLTVAERMIEATNAHDLEAMLACFHQDYRSEQPVHPARTFQGIDQVRKNWLSLLEAVPDIHWGGAAVGRERGRGVGGGSSRGHASERGTSR